MSRLKEIMEYNKTFVENKRYEEYTTSKYPDKKIVILSCMDTRLIQLLPDAMNFKNGDVKIVKNAGGMITHPFGSIMRSIIVAIYELGAEEVYVVGHKGCGMSNVDGEAIIQKMTDQGISAEVFDLLKYSGIPVNQWLHGFDCVNEAIKESVDKIKNHPLVYDEIKVHGLVMDPETGKLEVIVED